MKKNVLIPILGLAAAVCLASAPAAAAGADPQTLAAEIARLPKASPLGGFAVHSKQQCASCHGPNGISPTANWPHVTGQPEEATVKALLDYRAGRRSGGAMAGMMSAVARRMSDQDIVDVARLYAMLPGPDGAQLAVGKDAKNAPSEAELAAARMLIASGDPQRAITPCSSCHRTTVKNRTPVIQGQNPAYLARQLADYRDGRRTADVVKEMRFFAQKLTDAEIRALAALYGDMPGRPGADGKPPVGLEKAAK